MYEHWGKRTFDLVGALGLLLLAAPLMAATALTVGIFLGQPIFFRQRRTGHRGQPFLLLKFRSMAEGPGEDAVRLGRFGRALRASSLDELPQLLNVLRGEMSLVGPRPLLPAYLPLYTARQRLRLRVRPGMAGPAQAAGRNAVPWDRRLELDAGYATTRPSLKRDMAILLRCLLLTLGGRGITAEGHATMPPFPGSRD